jgi:DNA primase
MYNTNKVIDTLSLDNILTKTTEYDIYTYYIGKRITLGSIFSSPFRQDKNPSFGIFKSRQTGSLLYKDIAKGDSGNCVKFVQQKFQHLNLSYKEALKKIYEDIILNGISKSKIGVYIDELPIRSKYDINVQVRNFVDIDKEYWEQYNINKDTLNKYKVYPIRYVWINDVLSSICYDKTKPLYAYRIYNSFKIYNPLSTTKKDKWRTNCSKYDIQGLEQLPSSGDLLIITKSLKDVMVLSLFNINAIAPQSEASSIPINILNDIKKRFKTIIVFYDNDESGIENSAKLSKEHDLKNICLPKHYYDEYGIKDISDYIKKYGYEETKKILNNLIYE